MSTRVSTLRAAWLSLAATLVSGVVSADAPFVIINGDSAGEGFNDPTLAVPVGGNPGTTLGQQRLNAFAYVASLWGAALNSTVPIEVLATFDPLSCNNTGAVLGSAGAYWVNRDFSGATKPGTWYSGALANKLEGIDAVPEFPEIVARFNVNLGQPGCLTGSPFYLGLDNNPPPGAVNLVAVLLHEFAHGLGFQTFTSGTSGNPFQGFPTIYDHYLFDNTLGKSWVEMTAAERQFSAVNGRQVGWSGGNVFAAAPGVLGAGTPKLRVLAPNGFAGDYLVGAAEFGSPLKSPGLTRQAMPMIDANGSLDLACAPFSADNSRRAKNRVAIVLRGTCPFTTRVKNAQNAGAVGAIVIDNIPGTPPAGLGGADPTITIPSVRVTLNDGIALLGGLNLTPSGRSSGLVVRLTMDEDQLTGADPAGRVLVYTPYPFASGSSVSHWDASATPNLLMEPFISGDLTQSVRPPEDLTLSLFRDIGW